ncbi:hypothetical protein KP509_09G066600 [Ceratopteris richardii]|uniref:Uncharacterized protein n=1 Tax=Ceratopteris richardii TaxID=49495 RepID=A0A8T2U7Q0_CERRI|nr:hypothetical protein KP509_09G066600 [Ceratopteris richardii]
MAASAHFTIISTCRSASPVLFHPKSPELRAPLSLSVPSPPSLLLRFRLSGSRTAFLTVKPSSCFSSTAARDIDQRGNICLQISIPHVRRQ